jgi:hypothetical protein
MYLHQTLEQRLREKVPAAAAYRRLHALNQSPLHLPVSCPAPYKLTAPTHATRHSVSHDKQYTPHTGWCYFAQGDVLAYEEHMATCF